MSGLRDDRTRAVTPCRPADLLQRSYSACMVAITVRDVPEETRDVLASRAAAAGQSLQEYLRSLLVATADSPTVAEVVGRARARAAATGTRLDIDQILAWRDEDRA
jgi:plasmid stability protein